MNENYILIIFIIVFFALFAFGLMFISRALKQFNGKKRAGFEPLLYVQRRYDKIRKISRIPCGVLYITAGNGDMEKVSRNESGLFEHLGETLLASFDGKDDLVSKINSKEYVVLTRMSEPQMNSVTKQILHDTVLYSKANPDVPGIKISFGAYLIPASNVDFDETVARAKLACIESKNSSRTYVAWDYNLQCDYDNRVMIEKNLKNGIENNNFFLEFQPIIDIVSGNITGGEVLSRLNGESKVLLPADFISVVKDKNMDFEFDCYVFEKTCQWVSAHPEPCGFLDHVSVNFSRSTLATKDAAEKLLAIAGGYGIDRTFIAIEVLEDESGGSFNTENIRENMKIIKEAGMTVLLDDFGDGYSSFDDLKNFPADIIKISKSVTENIETQLGERIFKSIATMAKSMKVQVICEGVETLEQIEILRKNGIRFVQGYYFFRPQSPNQFEKAVLNNRTRRVQ